MIASQDNPIKIHVAGMSLFYDERPVLHDVSADFAESAVTALVGPSGAGKSTFLTTLNRLWQEVPGARMTGHIRIRLAGQLQNITAPHVPLTWLRRKVGMVFQTPNPLPMSIYRNLSFPLMLAGERNQEVIAARAEEVLSRAHLWNEVKDRLGADALTLSVGQQQRLCIARALMLEPEVLLLDEPTSALDETSGRAIETLIAELKGRLTILVVSHYTDQVERIADRVIRFAQGRLFE